MLIKQNTQKKRSVYKLDSGEYKKVWHFKDVPWLDKHVSLLNEYVPGYVKTHGWTEFEMYIVMNELPGIPANQFEHTDEFIKKIYNFCLNNIEQTKPYAHGDWVLSNIIVNGDNITMCDWDNFNLYPSNNVYKKMHNDLKSAFGDKFDTTSI